MAVTANPTLYSVDTLQRDVRIALDKNATSEALTSLGDIDTLTIDDIITSKLVAAARIVETIAPAALLDMGEPFTGTIYWPEAVGVGSGHIQLPEDFLRLVCFQMSDWKRAVYSAIDYRDPQYQLQSSPFGGLRGNPDRPVVAIVHWSTGLNLEFYSCTVGSGVYVKRARYIPMPRIDSNNQIRLCEKLYEAVVLKAASMVAYTLRDNDLAVHLEGECKELLTVNT